ncbi:alpha/beta hydrolase [Arenicella xantha]|uniref:alpha/beta hydrolase n=1 Tax=Arenicella xantha TaxID=644221 RepID=UPI002482838C|nr:alpha/beta hydrolase [Arenicella xantha]
MIFCGGFNSSRMGNKAVALEDYCASNGQEYIRFDYQAHGESGGDFGDCTISTWLDDTLSIIDSVAENQSVVLIGSSFGGWLALLATQRRPEKIVGLILIACAVDMTHYYPERLRGVPLSTDSLGRAYYALPNQYDDEQDYRLYQAMIEDGAQYRLLESDAAFSQPMHLIHGQDDDVIPWQRSLAILDQLASGIASFTLIKNGDHRLSSSSDLSGINHSLADLLATINGSSD